MNKGIHARCCVMPAGAEHDAASTLVTILVRLLQHMQDNPLSMCTQRELERDPQQACPRSSPVPSRRLRSRRLPPPGTCSGGGYFTSWGVPTSPPHSLQGGCRCSWLPSGGRCVEPPAPNPGPVTGCPALSLRRTPDPRRLARRRPPNRVAPFLSRPLVAAPLGSGAPPPSYLVCPLAPSTSPPHTTFPLPDLNRHHDGLCLFLCERRVPGRARPLKPGRPRRVRPAGGVGARRALVHGQVQVYAIHGSAAGARRHHGWRYVDCASAGACERRR